MNETKTTQSTEKKRKLIITVAIAIALFLLVIFSTLAYLTSTTNTLDNTMTAGSITLEQDEAIVDEYGKATTGRTAKTTDVQQKYTLSANHLYKKDPTLYVKKDSEDCYVYAGIRNDISGIEAKSTETKPGTTTAYSPIASQMETYGWKPLMDGTTQVTRKENVKIGESTTEVTFNVYYKTTDSTATVPQIYAKNKTNDQTVKVFDEFMISSSYTGGSGNTHIYTHGWAVQSDGFKSETPVAGDALTAWKAVFSPEPVVTYKPIQKNITIGGNETTVTFFPAYSGDTCPYNFFVKNDDDTYTELGEKAGKSITNMASLYEAMQKADRYFSKIYTDAKNATFYGGVRTIGGLEWNTIFDKSTVIQTTGFATKLNDNVKLPSDVSTVYFGSQQPGTTNWNAADTGESPKLNGIDYKTILLAYKSNFNDNVWSSRCSMDEEEGEPSSEPYVWNTDDNGWRTMHMSNRFGVVFSLSL